MRIKSFDNFLKIRLFFYFQIIALYYFFFTKPRENVPNIHEVATFRNKTNNFSQIFYEEKFVDFEGFDNITGANEFLVPNIVHYVSLRQTKIAFPLFLSILSSWLNQKPSRIYIHCDDCSFHGKYWNELLKINGLNRILHVNKLEKFKETIFKTKPGWIHHKSDVIRLLILMHYGGIYMDNDMILVNSLDKYRKFEIAVSWDSDVDGIGNQIFVANRNARLLKAMYDGYRENYDPSQWYYNGGFYPAKILLSHRYMAHSVKIKFGSHMLINQLFKSYWKEWKSMDCIHLLINHRSYLDKESPIKEFDESNIKDYKFTFGEIARELIQRAGAFKDESNFKEPKMTTKEKN